MRAGAEAMSRCTLNRKLFVAMVTRVDGHKSGRAEDKFTEYSSSCAVHSCKGANHIELERVRANSNGPDLKSTKSSPKTTTFSGTSEIAGCIVVVVVVAASSSFVAAVAGSPTAAFVVAAVHSFRQFHFHLNPCFSRMSFLRSVSDMLPSWTSWAQDRRTKEGAEVVAKQRQVERSV